LRNHNEQQDLIENHHTGNVSAAHVSDIAAFGSTRSTTAKRTKKQGVAWVSSRVHLVNGGLHANRCDRGVKTTTGFVAQWAIGLHPRQSRRTGAPARRPHLPN
jgi:hypothetical protein